MIEWLRNQSRALSIVSKVKPVNERSYSSPGASVRDTSCGWKTMSLKKKWWSQNNNYIPETYWIFTTLNNSLEHSTTNCIQLRWPQSLKKCSEPSSGSASIIINQYLSMSTSTMAVLNLKACLENVQIRCFWIFQAAWCETGRPKQWLLYSYWAAANCHNIDTHCRLCQQVNSPTRDQLWT